MEKSAPVMVINFGVYNEWGTLKEVAVGRVDTMRIPRYTPVIAEMAEPHVVETVKRFGGKTLKEADPRQYDAIEGELESLASQYQRYGVRVHRPRGATEEELADGEGFFQVMPADCMWIVGRHVIECSMRLPAQQKAVVPHRELMQPLMSASAEARTASCQQPTPAPDSTVGAGPYLEGGDIFLIGNNRDVLVGHTPRNGSNKAGAEWLAQYLSLDGYRVTLVPLKSLKVHLLAHIGCVGEKTAVIYRPAFLDGVPEVLTDWTLIDATEEEVAKVGPCVVALNKNRVLMPAECGRLADRVSKAGIEPVLTPMKTISTEGGGIRCSTFIMHRAID